LAEPVRRFHLLLFPFGLVAVCGHGETAPPPTAGLEVLVVMRRRLRACRGDGRCATTALPAV
jgi:hypothetical protein